MLLVLGACFHEGLGGQASIAASNRLPFEDALYLDRAGPDKPMPYIDPTGELLHQPSDAFSLRAFAAGRLPLWNPHNGLGAPLLGNGQSMPFNPLKLILWGSGATGVAQAWFLVSRLAVLALGTLVLARRLGMGPWGGTLAALVAALNGFIAYHFHFPEVHTVVALPWLLWVADRFGESPDRRRTAAFGLMIGLTGMLGHPEPALYVGVAAVAVALAGLLARGRRLAAGFAGLAAAVMLGAMMAAVVVLPFAGVVRESASYLFGRAAEAAAAPGAPPYNLYDALRLFARHFVGVEPDVNAYNFNAWVGTSALCLVPLGLTLAAPRRVALAVIGTFGLLLPLMPPTNVFMAPVFAPNAFYLPPLLAFGLALLAGAGLDAVLVRPGARRAFGAGALGLALAAFVGWQHLHNPAFYARMPHSWLTAWAGIATALLLFAGPRLPRAALGGGIALVAALELGWGARTAIPRLPAIDYPVTPVVAALKAAPGPFRVAGNDVALRPDTSMVFGLDSIELLDAFHGHRYRAFLAAINGRESKVAFSDRVEAGFNAPLLDLANVKYLLSIDGPQGNPWRDGLLVDPGRYRFVARQPACLLFENRRAMPRAWVAYAADYLPTGDPAAATRLAAGGERWRTRALVEMPGGRAPAGWTNIEVPVGAATVVTDGFGDLDVQATAARPGWLVVAEAYYPGWEATVDGTPAEIMPADVALRAVYLGPGSHTVRFHYRPLSVRLGLGLSGLALLLGAWAFLWPRRRLRPGAR